jgi:hypothetical protein
MSKLLCEINTNILSNDFEEGLYNIKFTRPKEEIAENITLEQILDEFRKIPIKKRTIRVDSLSNKICKFFIISDEEYSKKNNNKISSMTWYIMRNESEYEIIRII